jgi:hypothetical protein
MLNYLFYRLKSPYKKVRYEAFCSSMKMDCGHVNTVWDELKSFVNSETYDAAFFKDLLITSVKCANMQDLDGAKLQYDETTGSVACAEEMPRDPDGQMTIPPKKTKTTAAVISDITEDLSDMAYPKDVGVATVIDT